MVRTRPDRGRAADAPGGPASGPALALALAAVLWTSGCGASAPLEPVPPSQGARALAPDLRAELEADLARLFGPPTEPRLAQVPALAARGFDPAAPAPSGRSQELARAVESDNRSRFFAALRRLEEGAAAASPKLPESLNRALDGAADPRAAVLAWQPDLKESARVYQRECATCHGLAGGGDGPSAATLEPRPRDFRAGAFRHHVGGPDDRPDQDELVRVLRRGISGAGMPLFARLGAARHSGLADYVRFLGLRGEVERAWIAAAQGGTAPSDDEVERMYVEAWSRWAKLPDRGADGEPAGAAADGASPPGSTSNGPADSR